MLERGRTTALSAAIAGLVVLGTAGILGWDRIVERYHILRLRSADEAARLRSVQALTEARSVRAVPELIRLLGKEERERITHCAGWGMSIACGPGGSSMVPIELPDRLRLTPVAHALYRIGRETLPPQLEDDSLEESWRISAEGSAEVGKDVWWMLVQIRQAMDASDLIVEAAPYEDVRIVEIR